MNRDTLVFQNFYMLPKIGNATCETIKLGDDNGISLSCELYCLLKFRSLLNGAYLFAENFFAAFFFQTFDLMFEAIILLNR